MLKSEKIIWNSKKADAKKARKRNFMLAIVAVLVGVAFCWVYN